jgi:glutaredoxin
MRVIAVLVLFALPLSAAAAMYKWVDEQGRTQYSDTPPPANAKKVEEHKVVKNTIATTGVPFAVQEAAKRNPVTVWMSDCGELCNRARDYLAKRGIPHTVRNPSRQAEQEAWKKTSGGDNAIPLLVIGAMRTIKGFEEAQWDSALEAAGYPRAAPAIKPQAIPPAADAAAGQDKPVAQAAPQPDPAKK